MEGRTTVRFAVTTVFLTLVFLLNNKHEFCWSSSSSQRPRLSYCLFISSCHSRSILQSICVHWNRHYADLATERECQLTAARANHTTGLTNGRAANWAPEVVFSLFHTLSRRQLSLLNQPFYSGPTPRTDGFGFELINVSLSYSWWYTLILGGSCPGLSVITKKS